MKVSVMALYLGLLLSSSCQNTKSDRQTQTNQKVDTNTVSKDVLISDIENTANTKIDTVSSLHFLDKMKNKKGLIDSDYVSIHNFLITNNDESKSEEMGYTLFEYLKKSKANNLSFSTYLIKRGKKYQEDLLERLVKVMCIDIGEENYSYENFIKDFGLFKNSVAAKKALKDCMGNDVK
jgi:hypothetical protein